MANNEVCSGKAGLIESSLYSAGYDQIFHGHKDAVANVLSREVSQYTLADWEAMRTRVNDCAVSRGHHLEIGHAVVTDK